MSTRPTGGDTRRRVAWVLGIVLGGFALALSAALWLVPSRRSHASHAEETRAAQVAPAVASAPQVPIAAAVQGSAPEPSDHDQPARGVAVSGVVLDLTGGAIPGARIEARPLFPPIGSNGAKATSTVAESDADGGFELFAAPGALIVRASAGGYTPAQQQVTAPAANLKLELVPGARIVGEVVSADEGTPLAGIEVKASKHVALAFTPGDGRAVTDARGRFAIEGLSAGSFQLTARSERWFGRGNQPVVLAVAQAAGPVQIRAEPAVAVQGRVITESTGEPCRAGRVGLQSAPENELEFAAAAAIDELGTARFEGVPPGEYNAQVVCEGSPPRGNYPRVRVVGDDLSGLVWTVAAPVRLLGKLVDASGRGLAGRRLIAEAIGPLAASASANDPSGEDEGEASAGEAISDERGDFAIAGLRAGQRYRVELADDPTVVATAPLRADGTSGALVLQASASGTLLVHVTRAGAPVRGTVVVNVRGPLGTRTPQAAEPGTFALQNVAPASYTVSAQDGRNPAVSRAVAVRGSATVEVALDLPELSASLSGLVLDALGAPVRDAWVKAFTRDGPGFPADSTLTAADGSFALDSLDPSARYDLEVSRTTDPSDGARSVSRDAEPGQRVVVRLP